ncbi:hypothetical protein [Ciceribacter ferrooxidans]|nr:hypothetical protein [Ciceribacter ferrooxidans]
MAIFAKQCMFPQRFPADIGPATFHSDLDRANAFPSGFLTDGMVERRVVP